MFVQIVVAQGYIESQVEPDERRGPHPIELVGIDRVCTLVVKDQIGQIVTQLGGDYPNSCSGENVAEPVFVVGRTHQSRGGSYRIAADSDPWVAVAVLFVEHRGGHEGGGC